MSRLPRDIESRINLVQKAFARLPSMDQLVLRLHYCDDLPCEALTSLFGTTVRAIHVRLHRARKRFRAEIEEHTAPFANDP